MCVNSWRRVTRSLPLSPNSGTYRDTGASNSRAPSSTCRMTSTDVKSFDSEAMSNTVPVPAGRCSSPGSSRPSPSAYRSAYPAESRRSTTFWWAYNTAAPAKRGRPVAGSAQRRSRSAASTSGVESRPSSSGDPSRNVGHDSADHEELADVSPAPQPRPLARNTAVTHRVDRVARTVTAPGK